MIILGIETSCDETAMSLIESDNGTDITVLSDKTLTQIELHKQYGGVFPNMAKREHSKNLVPLLKTVLEEAGFLKFKVQSSKFKVDEAGKKDLRLKSKDLSRTQSARFPTTYSLQLKSVLDREPEMLEQFLAYIPTIEKPAIDAIAVTEGPGLEPCLWTGINLARALSEVWGIPIIPVNHMEGHIFSALLRRKECGANRISQNARDNSPLHTTRYTLHAPSFPALALLISGGHTELVLIKSAGTYEIIGQTRDDAVGEAFDKVARLLGLPYPGGPEISRLAESARLNAKRYTLNTLTLPRPMIHSDDYDFSFSGIKTSVLYLIQKLPKLTDDLKTTIALEFENAVTEVLVSKTKRALEEFGAKALLLGGGVVANTHIRRSFEKLSEETGVPLYIPEKEMTTDNALMIASVGLIYGLSNIKDTDALKARGTMRLD